MRTLYVAAGGGGDAVGALLARRALGDTDNRPALVSTCAWERLRIDPVPGPRARGDFTGLANVGGEACEVVPTSETIPPSRSVLPRLAETSGARIFLHDFDEGAVGLAGQLQRLSAALDVDRLVVIDVGGDVLARGPEPTLKSPLADSLTLAAAVGTGISTTVVVLGPGSDGELPEPEVLKLLEQVGGTKVGQVSSNDVELLSTVLSWHPTEATAMVAAGAVGVRGSVAMRRGRRPVPITDNAAGAWVTREAHLGFPLAQALQGTRTLSEAESVMRRCAVNEIDFERSVAGGAQRSGRHCDLPGLVSEMSSVGATHITTRRLAEVLGPQVSVDAGSTARKAGGLWSINDLGCIAGITGNGVPRDESPVE